MNDNIEFYCSGSPFCIVQRYVLTTFGDPSFFLQGFFAKMERSMLAADAEKVVAKGEMSDEEKEVARREAQAHAAHPDEEVVEDAIWRNVALDFMEDELELLRK